MRITSNPSDAETRRLGIAATDNLVALFGMMARLEGGEVEETPALGRHHSFPTNPMFKGVWRTRLADGDVEAAIDETIAWFKARNAPYFFWWTDDETRPADLGDRLMARGFISMEGAEQELAKGIVQTEDGAPVMAMSLADADPGWLSRTPPNFRIEPVDTPARLLDFKKVFVDTYQIPEWAGQAWVDATTAFRVGKSPWRMVVGYLEGQPVASNMLVIGGGVASVYAVATTPAAQRQGIGAAITLKPLLDARDEGQTHAVLFSSEPGHPVYRRIGFADTGMRINRYMWRAS
jgi:ribosomal protein S18 acetylase RimI-like enzyme